MGSHRSNGLGRQNWSRDLTFLLAGLGVGSAIAMLFTPSTGEELRHKLHRGSRRTVKSIARHTEDLRDHAEVLVEQAHDLRQLGSRLLRFGRRAG